MDSRQPGDPASQGRLLAKAHTLHRSVPVLTNDWLDQEYTPV